MDAFTMHTPQVMGILNVTPDSFYAGCRSMMDADILQRVDTIVAEGAHFIDIGACSTRPGSTPATVQEELKRVRHALSLICKHYQDLTLSVDTFRADVAKMSVEEFGVEIINDVSGGEADGTMFATVASLQATYILTFCKATRMTTFFAEKLERLHSLGCSHVILDPGLGFGKTIDENYQTLSLIPSLQCHKLPILIGVSRKSLIYKLLDITPDQALNGTTTLHTLSLMLGASILRVHDVREAVEAIRIVRKFQESKQTLWVSE